MYEAYLKKLLRHMNNILRVYLNDRDNCNNEQRAIIFCCMSATVRDLSDFTTQEVFDTFNDFDMFAPLQDYIHLHDFVQDYCCE